MTLNRRMLCLALALCMMITLLPSLSSRTTALAETRLGVTKDKVNMRYGAGTDQKIVFSLPKDLVCEIVGTTTVKKATWYKIKAQDPERKNSDFYTGYVLGEFFRELNADEIAMYNKSGIVATPTPLPVTSGDLPTPTPTPAPLARNEDLPATPGSIGAVTAGGTNLREGPGTNYHSIERLDRNTQVELLTIPSIRGAGTNTFFKVKYNETVGYIMSDFISILSGGPASGSSTVVTPTPTPASGNGGNGGGNATGLYTHVKLILSSCHMRVSPGGDYNPDNDWLGKGSVLPLAGAPVQKGSYTWYPVSRSGSVYYVRNDCVQPFSSSATPAPDVTPTPTPAPTPTVNPNGIGYVITTKGGCNLRATINGTVIKQIAKNVTLPYLLEPVKKNGYTWYFVQDGNNRGYLRSDVVKVVSGPTPTPTPTPVPGTTPAPTPAPGSTETPATPAVTEVPATGYVKTTSSGLNMRKKAGYTDVLGQLNKDQVLPYYGEPVTVKNVKWYYVYHKTYGYGYLHGDYVKPCNADGSPLATPTPEPTPTLAPGSTSAPANSGQEASYTTLKTGSSGDAVKNLVTELKNQGYYSGSITSKYTTAVAEAVKAFQKANGLTADGIAGAATQHKLFGTVPIGTGDTSNLTMTLYPAEKIDWYTGGINELWARGSNYKVYDVKTGIVWWAHRWAGGLHVDAEPLTAADTARLCRAYGVSTSQQIKDKNLYQRRPLLVTIGSRTFACSLYGVPHNYPEGDTISTNEFKGQVCIHFTNSKTHDSRKVDSGHEAAIQFAWENSPSGHK